MGSKKEVGDKFIVKWEMEDKLVVKGKWEINGF